MATPNTTQLDQVGSLYVALFNRAPDTGGLEFWSNALADGADLATLINGFLIAPEGRDVYPSGLSDEAFVKAFYEVALGREADAEGLQFWIDVLKQQQSSDRDAARGKLVGLIVDVLATPLTEAELNDPASADTLKDRKLFANKVDYGVFAAINHVVESNSPAASLVGITDDPASVQIKQDALSNTGNGGGQTGGGIGSGGGNPPVGNAESGTGGNDVFVKTSSDLNTANYTLDGVGGIDTLNLTASSDVVGSTANVSNVENVVIGTAVGTTAVTVNALRFAGADVFTVAAAGDVSITNLEGAQTVRHGGSSSGGTWSNGSSRFVYADGVAKALVEILDATMSAAQTTQVHVQGESLVEVAVASKITAESGVTLNSIRALTLGNQVESLTIDAQGGFSTSGGIQGGRAAALGGFAVTVTGEGRVDLGHDVVENFGISNINITKLDASQATGFITFSLGSRSGTGVYSYSGSQGRDQMRLIGNFEAGSKIDLGAGNDNVHTNSATFAEAGVVDGGDGIDTLVAGAVTGERASAYKNFEIVSLFGQAGFSSSTVDFALLKPLNTITAARLVQDSIGGATAHHVDEYTKLEIFTGTTGTTKIDVVDSDGDGTTKFQIDFFTSGQGMTASDNLKLELAEVNEISLNSQVGAQSSGNLIGANKLKLDAGGASLIKITGDTNLDLTLTESVLPSELLTVDGSTLTGALVLDLTGIRLKAGLSITGGTGADKFLLAGAATVTGGAGNDIFDVARISVATAGSALTDTDLAASMVSITDFGTGDTILVGIVSAGSAVFDASGNTAVLAESSLVGKAGAALQAANGAIAASFVMESTSYVVIDKNRDGSFGNGDVAVALVGGTALTLTLQENGAISAALA